MSRWQINKYGFVNFWLFDKEEIKTYGGNLLLTGENGSGKSVTLQSFIPLIFDGNTSSRRLSTEGDSSRQIEYYLLHGDKNEAISYIYAEFVKEDENKSRLYKTLIMGMKIKKGQGTPKKWFTILKDAKVGKELRLFNHTTEEIIPFDKADFKKKLEGLDYEYYEESSEYKRAVNDNLFGFKNIDEFEETIELLVELRQPNLRDNTGFDPKYIYEILNKSLKIISEKDLKSISDTFEKIEEISEELKLEQDQYKILEKIGERYERYKKTILAKNLGEYKENLENFSRNTKEIEKNREALEKLKESVEKLIEREEKLELERNSKIKERMEIQDKSQSIIERKAVKENEIKDLDCSLLKCEININKTDDFIKKYEDLKNKTKEEYDIYEKEYLSLEESLKSLEEKIAFKSEINYLSILDTKKDNVFISSDFNFERHKKNLHKLLELLDKNKEYNDKIHMTYKNINGESKELFNLQEKKKDIEKQNIEKLREFSGILSDRKGKLLNFNYGKIQTLISYIEDFEQEEFKEELTKNLNFEKEIVNKEINEYRRFENNLIDELKEIKKQKDLLEKETDIKIELLSHKKDEREKLSNRAFYEIIKFKEGVDQELQGKIEKALWEMGLLDSFVSLDDSVFDKFLSPNQRKEGNLTKYIEVEEDFENKDLVEQILSSIGTEETGDIYITSEGKYKNLLIYGVVDKWHGRYIGLEARKKLRLEKIEKLNKEIDKLEERVSFAKENIDELNKKNLLLQKEHSEILLSFKDGFEEIHRSYSNNLTQEEYIKKRIENYKLELLKLQESKNELIKKLENESKKLGLSIQEFDTLKEDLRAFEDNFQRIKDKYRLLLSIHNTYKNAEEMERENEIKLEDYKKDRRLFLKRKEDIKEILLNIQKEIETQGHNLAIKKLQELNLEIYTNIPQKQKEISEKKGTQKTKIENVGKDLQKALEIKDRVEEDYNVIRSLVNEELGKTDYTTHNSLFYNSEEKLKLYEEYKSCENYNYVNDINQVTEFLSKNELILKPFGLKLEEYNYTETREKYNITSSRQRLVLRAVTKGRHSNFQNLLELLKEQIGRRNEYLNEEEQKFFKEMLFGYIDKEIAERIRESKEWVKRIDSIMNRARTNSGKCYSLKWVSKNIGFGLNGEKLYTSILNLNNPSNKGEESESLIKEYFYKKTKELKNNAQNENSPKSSYEILKEVLDYRNWHEFTMHVTENATGATTLLTKRKLNSFSGGEKAMAMYVPLFSALYARFQNASESSLMIVSMDEAFSVVDDENIAKLFGTLEDLNLNYLLASQKLSGTYDTVKKLSIVYIENMTGRKNLSASDAFVTLIRYLWDGIERKRDLRSSEEGQVKLF